MTKSDFAAVATGLVIALFVLTATGSFLWGALAGLVVVLITTGSD